MIGAVMGSEVVVAGASPTSSSDRGESSQGADASDATAGEEEGDGRGRERRRGREVAGLMERS